MVSQQHPAPEVPVARGVVLPGVLGDPAREGLFMGEGNITNPSTAACLYPPLSLLTLKYPLEIVALAMGHPSWKDSPNLL